jgi:hypothetical protein
LHSHTVNSRGCRRKCTAQRERSDPPNSSLTFGQTYTPRDWQAARADAEFLRSRRAVLYGHDHFRTSGTREGAFVFKPINSGPLVSNQCLIAFAVSLHQLVHHLFGGQRKTRLNRGGIRWLRRCHTRRSTSGAARSLRRYGGRFSSAACRIPHSSLSNVHF